MTTKGMALLKLMINRGQIKNLEILDKNSEVLILNEELLNIMQLCIDSKISLSIALSKDIIQKVEEQLKEIYKFKNEHIFEY